MPAPEVNTSRTADDSQRPLSGASAPYLFRVLECDRLGALPARACLQGIGTITIGRRNLHGAELRDGRLSIFGPDPFLSSVHTRIRRTKEGWVLEDKGSKNGTLVGGVRVRRHLLKDGDLFEAGHTFFLFRASLPRPEPASAWVEASELRSESGLLTLLPQLEAAFAQLRAVAPSKLPLLIAGETGTGKELAASAAHALSGRVGPLKAVNCAAIEPALLEAKLFGHARGAFPGAVDDEAGLLRASDGGTLFLDEIGELPLPTQATLLRALQQSEVTPMGAAQAVKIDLRLIAATHHDLPALAAAGAFRSDLLARLQGFVLELPPLRERKEDLGLLVGQLLRRHAQGPKEISISPEAARALFSHRWPLNVHELAQALSAAVLLTKGEPIGLEQLPAAVRAAVPGSGAPAALAVQQAPAGPAPAGLSLFHDLARRRVFRSLVAYGVVAFTVLQVIEPIMHGLHWPDEVLTYAVLALTVGFPLTALLSWAYDLRAGRILRAAPTRGLSKGRLVALLLALGVLAAAPGLAWYFLLRGR